MGVSAFPVLPLRRYQVREETQAEKLKRWCVTVDSSCRIPAPGTHQVSKTQSLPSRGYSAAERQIHSTWDSGTEMQN